MSEHSEDHPIKTDEPLGSTVYEVIADTPQSVPATIESITAPRVSALESLDDDKVKELSKRKKKALDEISRGFSQQKIKSGIYTEEGRTYVVCPSSFFESDNIIGAMINDFSQFADFTIKLVDEPVKLTSSYSEKFIMGLWFGIFSSVSLKRRSGKKDYELGRACSFALIIKSVFAETKQLGMGALARDNFFFGNNPTEKNKNGIPIPFYIKTTLRSYFDNKEQGDLVLGIINRTAHVIGVSYLKEDESDKMITDNLFPVDQLISSCYPVVTVGKGKKITQKVRKPNPIKSSPLYLKEEMELITALTSPIFSELSSIVESYEECIFAQSYDHVRDHIRSVINLRWETLQRFANRTKIRLQDIRTITKDANKRKATVTQSDVDALLWNQADNAARLVREIQHILGDCNIVDIYSQVYKTTPASEPEAWLLIHNKAFNIYKLLDDQLHATDSKFDNIQTTDLDKDYLDAYKTLSKLQEVNGKLIKNMSLVSRTKYFKLYGRFKQIENLHGSTVKQIAELRKLRRPAVDMAVTIYHEGLYKDFNELYFNYIEVFRDEAQHLSERIDRSLTFEKNEAARKALQTFYDKCEQLTISGLDRALEKES